MKPACTSFAKPLVTFNTLKEVRSIERNILSVEPLLASFDTMLDDIREAHESFSKGAKAMNSTLPMMSAIFDQFRKEAASYRRQANQLDRRAQSTAQSVMDSLNLGFQQLAQSQNRNTFIMAKSAREDSIAIRAITLVTSFYLPFSFVAVSLLLPFQSSRN
jgi:ABC-type transporter Mla subunit MlaD